MKRFLLKHVGNMGDMVFFIPPVLERLKAIWPDCHTTLVTAWGYKDRHGRWGRRNQGGYCLHLLLTNPHIDRLVHYHDRVCARDGSYCEEDGQRLQTWNRDYFERQKRQGGYDGVWELDFGLAPTDNPLQRMYQTLGLAGEDYSNYRLYFTAQDLAVADSVTHDWPRPRIILLEGLESITTRGWDPGKIPLLTSAMTAVFGVPPLWFGSKHQREIEGRTLRLRENIATLQHADVALGVPSGPLHFAAAVGLPTITLYADQPLHRAAPAYFLNKYIKDPAGWHRTLLGPTGNSFHFLKNNQPSENLTPAEAATQRMLTWQHPGRQSTKTGLAAITVDEVMTVLRDMVNVRYRQVD